MVSVYGHSYAASHPFPALSIPLPLRCRLKDKSTVLVDHFREESDLEQGLLTLNTIIDEGLSWPFEETFDMAGFKNYFLKPHGAFVVRDVDSKTFLGMFYVKPNFPGRCAHVCNGGFITLPQHRGRGIGQLMARCFLRFAKDLGYKASLFNLV